MQLFDDISGLRFEGVTSSFSTVGAALAANVSGPESRHPELISGSSFDYPDCDPLGMVNAVNIPGTSSTHGPI